MSIEFRRSEPRSELVVLDRVTEDHLADRLVSSGRIQVVHRPFQFWRPPATGPIIRSDWILYGSVAETVRGSFDADPPECACEVVLQARVIRTEDGLILYSKRHVGAAAGRTSAEIPALLDEAARQAAGKLADDLIDLAR